MSMKKIKNAVTGLALVAALGTAPVALAAVDMFLKIEGIPGESADSVHRGEIDVLAWSWGTTGIVNGQGCKLQDLSLTKYIDKASPKLLSAVVNGQTIVSAKLTVRKAGENPVEYVVIELGDVTVTSLSTGGSGGEDRLTENVTLAFGIAKLTYRPQSSRGEANDPISSTVTNTCKR